jgi:hypothetical protein
VTRDELRAKYNAAYKIIAREREKRAQDFRHDPVARKQRLAEMDRLLEIVTAFKDELKQHITNAPQQPQLLDVPRKVEYK